MTKFNSTKVGTKTVTKEGGVGFTKTPELELVQLLINSSLAGDKFYEDETELLKRLRKLYTACNKSDITFFPKASIFARDKFCLRSISHLCSAIIGEGIKNGVYTDYNRSGERSFLRNYFKKVILRGDDVTETISAFRALTNTVKMPHAMVRGLSDAQANWDEYTYAKYRQDKKDISMMDAVRLTHTAVTNSNKDALNKLVNNELRNTTTWEATVSNAGKSENKEVAKAEAWANFVAKGEKVEYFALLRNLRNIIEEASEDTVKKAAELLVNEKLIKRSRVLPFRYLTAYQAVRQGSMPRSIALAINKAAEISLNNVPSFDGKTCIIIDESGSMECNYFKGINVFTIAMMFGAALYKTNEADMMMFSGEAWYVKPNPADSILSIATSVGANGGWTRLDRAFEALDKAYDRVIVLSDEQTAGNANSAWNNYKRKFNCSPYLYSFNLAGYNASAMARGKSIEVGGFSDKAFEIMEKTEIDKNALINEVKSIVI